MTAGKIVPVDMDIHAPAIDEYARYGGLKPGMVVGELGLPFDAPEPVPSWDDMTWRERIDSIKPGLAVVAGLILFIVAVGLVGIGLASGVRS